MMRYLVLAFLCLIAVIGYVQRLGIQTADKPIQAEFRIDTEQFGMLSTALLLGYALLQLPSGWLADRIGSRNALASYAILWSSLTASIALCQNFESLLIVWFLMGAALAGIFPCAAKSIGVWFPDTEKATASGILGSFMMLGTAVAAVLTARLLTDWHWSWRWIYVFYGGLGIAWALLYLLTIPERTGPRAVAPPMTRSDWHRMLTSAPLWFLCGQQFFRAGAMIFFINWLPKFLKESRNLEPNTAGDYAAYVNLAALVGGLLGGIFSDWLLRRTGLRRLSRQGIAVLGMAGAAVLIFVAARMESIGFAIVLFSLAAFIATFGGVSGYTIAIEFGGRRVGLVFSVMNMCGNFGAAIVNQAVTSLKERTGSWDVAVTAVAIILLVDAVCWALLNPKRPLFEDHHETR